MGLLEYDSGFRSVHEEARRSAYVRFTPFSFQLLARRQTYSRVMPKIGNKYSAKQLAGVSVEQ